LRTEEQPRVVNGVIAAPDGLTFVFAVDFQDTCLVGHGFGEEYWSVHELIGLIFQFGNDFLQRIDRNLKYERWLRKRFSAKI
jgi:hypothetical protein